MVFTAFQQLSDHEVAMTLEAIVAEVRKKFIDGPPNGWLLGWDAGRHFALLRKACAPHVVTNNTSFDYAFCNRFDVRVNSDVSERHWIMTIRLSFIVPTYCVHWTQYESRTEGRVINRPPIGYEQVEHRVRDVLLDNGFFELPDVWLDEEISGVELELGGTENVTLSKCLFEDYADHWSDRDKHGG